MQDKVTRYEWLKQELSQLNDDPTKHWSDYPCLEWPFYRFNGYGKVRVDGASALVHRTSLILTIGEIGDLLACHHCDNPPCFRPIHLFPGLHADNVADMMQKGRQNSPRRAQKLTSEEVKEIRELRRTTGVTYAEIALLYDAGENAVRRAAIGETWKLVETQSVAHINGRLTAEDIDHIRALSEVGSPSEIANYLGIKEHSVRYHLQKSTLLP